MNRFLFHFRQQSPKDFAVLRQAGFVTQEIVRLCRLRDSYQSSLQDLPVGSQNRFLFARWLVQQGKLDEGLH